MTPTISAPLLADAIPELARELESLLAQEGEAALSAQVRQLRIVDRCRCGDDFCAMIYTAPHPKGSWGAGAQGIGTSPSLARRGR